MLTNPWHVEIASTAGLKGWATCLVCGAGTYFSHWYGTTDPHVAECLFAHVRTVDKQVRIKIVPDKNTQ